MTGSGEPECRSVSRLALGWAALALRRRLQGCWGPATLQRRATSACESRNRGNCAHLLVRMLLPGIGSSAGGHRPCTLGRAEHQRVHYLEVDESYQHATVQGSRPAAIIVLWLCVPMQSLTYTGSEARLQRDHGLIASSKWGPCSLTSHSLGPEPTWTGLLAAAQHAQSSLGQNNNAHSSCPPTTNLGGCAAAAQSGLSDWGHILSAALWPSQRRLG